MTGSHFVRARSRVPSPVSSAGRCARSSSMESLRTWSVATQRCRTGSSLWRWGYLSRSRALRALWVVARSPGPDAGSVELRGRDVLPDALDAAVGLQRLEGRNDLGIELRTRARDHSGHAFL